MALAIDYSQEIRLSSERIISEATLKFEKENGKYLSYADKELVEKIHFELIYLITERVDNKELVSISPLRFYLLESILKTGVDKVRFEKSVSVLWSKIKDFVKSFANYDINYFNTIKTYGDLLSRGILDLEFFKLSPTLDILQKIPQYQYSDQIYRVNITDSDEKNNKIFTLFPKTRYWEYYVQTDEDLVYNPFYYNRVTSLLGLNKYKIPVTYDSLIIYDNKLYKLNPTVSSPDRQKFNASEWIEFNSSRFNKSKSFSVVYENKIKELYTEFLGNSLSINEVISDSNLSQYKENIPVTDSILPSTFGGEGKLITQELYRLSVISNYFGGYEGSMVGGMEYASKYTEYLLSCAFGRNTGDTYDSLDGKSLFGNFDSLFDFNSSENKIAGLSFLRGFSKLKSFSHGQKVDTLVKNAKILAINPIYFKYRDGIKDSYSSYSNIKPYFKSPNIDLILYSLENLYNRCLFVGDRVESVFNAINSRGILPGYEGLGNIEAQVILLQNIFPPSRFIKLDIRSKNAGGLTGSIKKLFENYSKFSRFVVNPQLPSDLLNELKKWLLSIFNSIESLVKLLEKLGLLNRFIPNLYNKKFQINDQELISYLRSLGFRDSEINSILSVQNFQELILNFAPISDSQDLRSFFKAYELSQLIYEFAGDEGISTYLRFLYSPSNSTPLINILNLSQKNISKSTTVNIKRYPKLIGLLIGFTYAVDPTNLIKISELLQGNSLTLLESIQYLIDLDQPNLLKDPSDIDLLVPMVKQIIEGKYIGEDPFLSPDLDYQTTNDLVPIALRQWTELIGKNLGQIESKDLIKGLYDKSVGLTPKELFVLLNNPKTPGNLSNLLDGFNGGEFTKFMKYALVSGLGVKLGYYKNSYQLNNFDIGNLSESGVFTSIIGDFDKILDLSKILTYVLDSSLNYSTSTSISTREFVESFVSIQNRDIETFSKMFELFTVSNGSVRTFSNLTYNRELFSRPLIESPGIGNSRLPNRSAVVNSITPEQYQVLFGSETSSQPTQVRYSVNSESIVNRFIKFTEDNKLLSGITNPPESSYRINGAQDIIDLIDNKVNQGITKEESPVPISYELLQIYSDKTENEIVSPALGTFYISDDDYLTGFSEEQILKGLLNPFDAQESCIKFNGTNCEQYKNTFKCSKLLNKSFFPETYSDVPGRDPNSIAIDRPLGTFSKYVPGGEFIPSSSFDSPPGYFNLLPDGTLPGKKNEPITPTPFPDVDLDSTRKNPGDISEFMNTEFGLIQAVRNKIEKNDEFGCASFSSPFEYQVCMNIMKCKRFSPPLSGKYFLDFCPVYFSGGRAK